MRCYHCAEIPTESDLEADLKLRMIIEKEFSMLRCRPDVAFIVPAEGHNHARLTGAVVADCSAA
jgi:hypothetical protein